MFLYLSHPWAAYGARPAWMDVLVADLGIEFFDPGVPLATQVPRISGLGSVNISEPIRAAFGLPQEVLLEPGPDILAWERPLAQISTAVWRDLYFLVRAGGVVADANNPHLGDTAVELPLAHALGIPIILISERVNVPAQLRYLADAVLQPNHPRISQVVRGLLSDTFPSLTVGSDAKSVPPIAPSNPNPSRSRK